MSENITQTRLSTRLDIYLREYTAMSIRRGAHSNAEWKTVWHVADVARRQNMLTPELVDDVRRVLKKLETAREILRVSVLPEVPGGGV